jgi:predicted PurR-regulated permease PerM
MKKEYFFVSIFFTFVILTIYLFYQLLAPFLQPILWAAIFVIIFYPLYDNLESWIRSSNMRSLIMTALVVVLIIGPASYLAVALVQEAVANVDLFRHMAESGRLDNFLNLENSAFFKMIAKRLEPYVDISQFDLKTIIGNAFRSVSKAALKETTNILTNAGRFLFSFGLMIFFMFFLFRDGDRLFAQIKSILPLKPENAEKTINHLKHVIEGTMYGGLVVALVQGIIGGLLFLIMGLPAAVFWGAVMAFTALIPILGPFLVYIPAGIILIIGGSVIKGILLISIGVGIVSQIDNFLRPMLVSGKTGMHTMLLFVSIMGGVNMFGLLGVVLGPFIAAVFVTMLEIYRFHLAEELEEDSTLKSKVALEKPDNDRER